MIFISNTISLNDSEVDISAIRAQGAGGQNVNKVSSAIHLRFDIHASSLSDVHKQRLLDSKDSRITKEGVFVLKAQQFRTQERNKIDAFERLQSFIIKATYVNQTRKPTKPSRNAKRKRVDQKTQRGKTKVLRGKVDF
ncbi:MULTISPECIES: alternative ribosome rescue aminoacyl-tRNA hydrolase ArfB [unclassified Psychrobacter]|jgi:ribosome-associated protein|uniref:alternative ribosome rescue aminoacyl-tRNA hydrolase ArfB n=1 Tax=unclassified Psychrobacter TaxID=196806 RepID=UPI000ED9EF11|nr:MULTISPECIES: alternative ribosome rescue aminoacyl-tRNA hydrolase ArfB [unclassified Psychrobacter]MBE8610025.1 aminoacyl-tRNA hydrolase [Pseudomonas lundensis]HCI74715.1 aminoacyl-tRNA hydrolase [Psychrobacter sp.]